MEPVIHPLSGDSRQDLTLIAAFGHSFILNQGLSYLFIPSLSGFSRYHKRQNQECDSSPILNQVQDLLSVNDLSGDSRHESPLNQNNDQGWGSSRVKNTTSSETRLEFPDKIVVAGGKFNTFNSC